MCVSFSFLLLFQNILYTPLTYCVYAIVVLLTSRISLEIRVLFINFTCVIPVSAIQCCYSTVCGFFPPSWFPILLIIVDVSRITFILSGANLQYFAKSVPVIVLFCLISNNTSGMCVNVLHKFGPIHNNA